MDAPVPGAEGGTEQPHVWIVGASSGVGAAVARRLAQTADCALILHGRSRERLEGLRAGLEAAGSGPIRCVTGDVRDWLSGEQPDDELPVLHGIVWSAGICELAPAAFLRKEALQEILEVNLIAPLLVLGRLFQKRRIARGGSIVLLGSAAATSAGAGFTAYAASKGGLGAAARVLEEEFSRREIRVCCLEPGTLETPMTQRLREDCGYGRGVMMDSLDAVVEEVVGALNLRPGRRHRAGG